MNFEQCMDHPSFAAIFASVKESIDKFDPYNLLRLSGAPDDEYDVESKQIATLILKSRLDSNGIAGHTNIVFTHMFGTFPRHYSFDDCIPVAREIIEGILARGYSVDYFPVK